MAAIRFVNFTDIVSFAHHKKGYDWNTMCDELDFLRPGQESSTYLCELEELTDPDEGWDERPDYIKELVLEFFGKSKIIRISGD